MNTAVFSGTATRPQRAACSAYRRACRAETPNRPASARAASQTGRGGSRGPELIEPIGEHGDQPLQLIPA